METARSGGCNDSIVELRNPETLAGNRKQLCTVPAFGVLKVPLLVLTFGSSLRFEIWVPRFASDVQQQL